MIYTKDLVFFDKSGTDYNFDYDEEQNLWHGTINIAPVSEGLFETEKIYVTQKYCVLEEDINQDMTNPVRTYVYGYPGTVYPAGSGDYYEFRWDSEIKEVDEINMFGFNRNVCPPEDTSSLTYFEYDCPELVYMDNVRIGNLSYEPVDYDEHGQNPDGIYYTRYKTNANWRSGYLDVNLCFSDKNDEYHTFRRDLFLYYIDPNMEETVVGHFIVYAKSIEEDERLSVMCQNLGYRINNDDFSIFQDSDIKEQLIDHDLMNIKRKEMLMEGHNIYPFIGSYKSLINAIRFFGYDNVTIKEWWKNVDFDSVNYGKYFTASSYSLQDHEVIHDGETITLPSKKFRKTGKLSLVYDINKIKTDSETKEPINAQSSYYGHYYPETDEQFTYTIEEAVIKLYGLKRKLEKEFLPLSTHIIDITGEASGFYASVIRTNPSENISFDTDVKTTNIFSVLGSEDGNFYIEDLRPFGIHPNELPHGNGIVGISRNGQPQFIGGSFESLYDANIETGSDLLEFGQNILEDYNTNWNINGSEFTGSDIEGYAQDWDLNQIADFNLACGSDEIADIIGTGTCDTGSDYEGPAGVVPPYMLEGDALFGVAGPTHNNCAPWIYYNLVNANNYGNYYLAEFSSYYPNLTETYRQANDFESDENIHLPDNENIPVGALVELKIDENEVTWNDLTFTWDYISDVRFNYLNLYCDNICRVEWRIHKDEDINPGFDTTIAGTIAHGYSDIGIVLPYIGDYDIEMRLFDWNNNVNVVKRKSAVSVISKMVEFTGWCKMKTTLLTWNSERIWESLSNEWNFPYVNSLTWNDVKSATFAGLDRGFFSGQFANTDIIDESMLIYNFADFENNKEFAVVENNRGAYYWDNLDVAWQDMDHLWWNAMNICGDIPCYFEFGYFDTNANPVESSPGMNDDIRGKWLEIVDQNNNFGYFKFPMSTNNLNYIADVTRMLNESNDPVLSQFYYSYIWDYRGPHDNLNIPEGFHIVATSKNHGKNGDIKFVEIVSNQYFMQNQNNILHARRDPNNKQLRFFTNSVECNPNWNDLVCINNVTHIPAYTDVNFNYTNCRILGKKNPEWRFENLNTGTVYTSTKKNYHRLFKEKGCWRVTLKLNDTNNNTYTTSRNILIIE